MKGKTVHGLARAQTIYQDRSARAKELKAEGKRVVGYVCLYPVIELITAAGMVPYRIFGDMREPISKADSQMAPVVCPFMRSCLDTAMKGRYDFLDGVVFAHVCDVTCMIPSMWRQTVPTEFTYFLDVPHTTHAASLAHFRSLVGDFRKALEGFGGVGLTDAAIREAVAEHNSQRALVRALYDLRRPDPPLISASETLKVLKAVMSLPVEDGNTLLREAIEEVNTRKNVLEKKRARLLVWGSIIDDTAFLDMVESLDANIVMDDMCVGSRAYFSDVPVTGDPLVGLAEHYLRDLKCPRTVQDSGPKGVRKDYLADLEKRFAYVTEYARDWKVNGVILQSVRYCDGHGYEVPGIKDFLAASGLPSIYLEHDYTEGALAPMRTRVQGLTEIIG